MSPLSIDVVTVGGGLGASAFAMSMVKQGARVLILEKEIKFKDRVRGEFIVTWGVTEARELGIAELLVKACAKEIPGLIWALGREICSRRRLSNCRLSLFLIRRCKRHCWQKRNALARKFGEA